MLSLEKIELEDAATANQYRLDAQRDQIARLETELAVLKDKHNRFTGMLMAAMSDEIKVMISGEVSEQLSKTVTDWTVVRHSTEIMDLVNDEFDIDGHQYAIENIIDNHVTVDNFSEELNDKIRDYLDDCTMSFKIETP
tara:strand:+ start:1629 stop:2045 length:417 start_codon:yes stop_codon:yes gene_type:complete